MNGIADNGKSDLIEWMLGDAAYTSNTDSSSGNNGSGGNKDKESSNVILTLEEANDVLSEGSKIDTITGLMLEPTVAFITVVVDSLMTVLTKFMTPGVDWEYVMPSIENAPDSDKNPTCTIENVNDYKDPSGHFWKKLRIPNFTYSPEEIFSGKIQLLNINFIQEGSADGSLRSAVIGWYKVLRTVALVGLIPMLIYIGIRILLSANAKDKSKYKEMFFAWIVGGILAFTIHYIMAFILSIMEGILDALSSATNNITVDIGGKKFDTNLIGLARFKMQQHSFIAIVSYLAIYIALVTYTFKFTFIYFKRVFRMAFLTLVAPIVALTYPLEKVNDGKAQGFEMWLKEFIYNVALQPMHLILYYILVTSSISLATNNLLYAVACLMFLAQAEKILKKIFGFGKAGTVDGMAGAFTTGVITSKITNVIRDPSQALGGGCNSSNNSSGGSSKITSYNLSPNDMIDDTSIYEFVGIDSATASTEQKLKSLIPNIDKLLKTFGNDLQGLRAYLLSGAYPSVNLGNIDNIMQMISEYQNTKGNKVKNGINKMFRNSPIYNFTINNLTNKLKQRIPNIDELLSIYGDDLQGLRNYLLISNSYPDIDANNIDSIMQMVAQYQSVKTIRGNNNFDINWANFDFSNISKLEQNLKLQIPNIDGLLNIYGNDLQGLRAYLLNGAYPSINLSNIDDVMNVISKYQKIKRIESFLTNKFNMSARELEEKLKLEIPDIDELLVRYGDDIQGLREHLLSGAYENINSENIDEVMEIISEYQKNKEVQDGRISISNVNAENLKEVLVNDIEQEIQSEIPYVQKMHTIYAENPKEFERQIQAENYSGINLSKDDIIQLIAEYQIIKKIKEGQANNLQEDQNIEHINQLIISYEKIIKITQKQKAMLSSEIFSLRNGSNFSTNNIEKNLKEQIPDIDELLKTYKGNNSGLRKHLQSGAYSNISASNIDEVMQSIASYKISSGMTTKPKNQVMLSGEIFKLKNKPNFITNNVAMELREQIPDIDELLITYRGNKTGLRKHLQSGEYSNINSSNINEVMKNIASYQRNFGTRGIQSIFSIRNVENRLKANVPDIDELLETYKGNSKGLKKYLQSGEYSNINSSNIDEIMQMTKSYQKMRRFKKRKMSEINKKYLRKPIATRNNPLMKLVSDVNDAPVTKGLKNVGKTIIKPVWNVGDGFLNNSVRLTGKVLTVAAGVPLGVAAAAVQAGISITDGEYHPLEAVGIFTASMIGVSKLSEADPVKKYIEEKVRGISSDWSRRDDVSEFFEKEFYGDSKKIKTRAAKNYVTRGIFDLKEQKQALKFANKLIKEKGLDEETADRLAIATLQYKKSLVDTDVLFNKAKRDAYLKLKADTYFGAISRENIIKLHNDFLENVLAFDKANM